AVAVVRPVNGLVWQQTPRGGEIRRTVVIAPGDPLKDIEVLEVKSDRPELVIAANKVERNTQRMIDLKFALADTTPLGNFSATVTVRVRVEGEESTLTVPVRGDVVGDIVVTPQELNVTRAPTARGERLGGLLVRGSGAGDAPRIRAVLAEGAVRAEISKGQSAEQPHVDVYVSDDAPGGAQQAYVYVVTTSTDQPVVQIPVYFVAPMLVEALPAAVVFEGDDTVQRVEIKDFNGAPVSITRATSAHDSVSVSVDASATGQIEVRRGAAALRELRDTQVIIETTMPGALRITIPVAIRE
ncbi:MAG TPA: hypothetical protein PLJ47_06695, partial [Candidatus Hydrogenedentes bacterium]|nr:hypothetical protein [Candidatus Hydrogenedentota bacterium]